MRHDAAAIADATTIFRYLRFFAAVLMPPLFRRRC